MKMFVVSVIDYSDFDYGKPHVLGIFRTPKQAKDCVRRDITDNVKILIDHGWDEDELIYDYFDMVLKIPGSDTIVWNIEKVEIPE